jgi:uncharacterized protein YggT (Ycf19 family)
MRPLLLLIPALAAASAHIGVLSPIALHREHHVRSHSSLAFAIPGDSVPKTVLIDGLLTFSDVYAGLYSLRILLNFVPQARNVALLRPVYVIGDVYFTFFRETVPPILGFDISIGACSLICRRHRYQPLSPPALPNTRPLSLRTVAAWHILHLFRGSVESLAAPAQPSPPQIGRAGRARKVLS